MTPYLSIVAASRNDNHGGDLTNRMNLFLRGLYVQLEKYRIPAEILLVEWNPPADRPGLHEILPKPSEGSEIVLRIVTVPKELHDRYKAGINLPLFQMIAKNVGIRRARAPFVLCTNVDLLFSDRLMQFLAKKALKKGTYYRCNRCDIPKEIDYSAEIPELLRYARTHIVQRLGKNHRYPNFNGESKLWYKNIFTLGVVWGISLIMKAFEPKIDTTIASMDTWACGDFTLMHQEDWEKIQGYFELDAYSIHIDSLALFAALGQGIQQKILPPEMCTFHISHQSGWELQDPMKKIYFDIQMPMLDWNTARTAGEHMLIQQEILPVNDEKWGFVDIALQERVFGG